MSSKYTVVYIPDSDGHPECLGLFDRKIDAMNYLREDVDYNIAEAILSGSELPNKDEFSDVVRKNDFAYIPNIGTWQVTEIIPVNKKGSK